MDEQGRPWVSLLGTNKVVRLDPKTLAVQPFPEATSDSRSRRIEVTADGSIWYGDEPRGYLGRIDPATGKVTEYAMPGGARRSPTRSPRMAKAGFGSRRPGRTRSSCFDPKSERFVAVHDVSETIRHMMYDPKTGAMWFGTDANQIGRVLTRSAP